jgi:hypothetical protein
MIEVKTAKTTKQCPIKGMRSRLSRSTGVVLAVLVKAAVVRRSKRERERRQQKIENRH